MGAVYFANGCVSLFTYPHCQEALGSVEVYLTTIREYSTLASFFFSQSALLYYMHFFKAPAAILRIKKV